MIVTRRHPTRPAPEHVVDGPASYEALAAPTGPAGLEVLHVHFAPGSRTRWHTHPLGQLLVVTSGAGWVQRRGDPPEPLLAGDVVRVEANEEHWHGAAARSAMSHLAVQEHDGRPGAAVLGPVGDDDDPEGPEHP